MHNNFIYFFICFETESHSIAQAGVKWHNLSSLHPVTSGFKQISCPTLASSWNYRRVPPCLASGGPPASTSQSAGIIGMSRHAWP